MTLCCQILLSVLLVVHSAYADITQTEFGIRDTVAELEWLSLNNTRRLAATAVDDMVYNQGAEWRFATKWEVVDLLTRLNMTGIGNELLTVGNVDPGQTFIDLLDGWDMGGGNWVVAAFMDDTSSHPPGDSMRSLVEVRCVTSILDTTECGSRFFSAPASATGYATLLARRSLTRYPELATPTPAPADCQPKDAPNEYTVTHVAAAA